MPGFWVPQRSALLHPQGCAPIPGICPVAVPPGCPPLLEQGVHETVLAEAVEGEEKADAL